ncbi:hypothetical protein AWB64_02702 [Caballeronia sordidicola]|uniref:Uncharacterized protein n=1 Tax=Caballeronia sordidicola TaxID=196367 RepID=A0A158GF34_CABSO|nr:hypothetical protein AWB64_02702 [Caballeronia sordidicola]
MLSKQRAGRRSLRTRLPLSKGGAMKVQNIKMRGAVCDSPGRWGRKVKHSLSQRTLAIRTRELRSRNAVLLTEPVWLNDSAFFSSMQTCGVAWGISIDDVISNSLQHWLQCFLQRQRPRRHDGERRIRGVFNPATDRCVQQGEFSCYPPSQIAHLDWRQAAHHNERRVFSGDYRPAPGAAPLCLARFIAKRPE